MLDYVIFVVLRRYGVLSIKFEDFICNDDKWFLRITGKGNKVAFVPCKQEWIDDVFKLGNNGKVFNISAWGVNKALKKYCRLAGIREISCHDTRRSCSTNLIKKGVNLAVVKDFMRHESINTTLRYKREIDKYNNEILEFINW